MKSRIAMTKTIKLSANTTRAMLGANVAKMQPKKNSPNAPLIGAFVVVMVEI
jgi:hypothetical protein